MESSRRWRLKMSKKTKCLFFYALKLFKTLLRLSAGPTPFLVTCWCPDVCSHLKRDLFRTAIHFAKAVASHLGLVTNSFRAWFAGLKPEPITAVYLMRGRALSDDSPRNVEGAAVSINQSRALLLTWTDCSSVGGRVMSFCRLVCRLETGCCTAVSRVSSLWLVECLSNWKGGRHNSSPQGCPKFSGLGIIGYPSIFTAQPGIIGLGT